MLRLDRALRAWGTPEFEAVLKEELTQKAGELPLQEGLTAGSYVLDDPVTVVINRVTAADNLLHVHAGVFFKSIVSGCSCEGDPTPTPENNEYCEVDLDIDRGSAMTRVTVVPELHEL